MLKQVQNTINRYGLLTPGDSVLVALSGGPDSVALLHVLVKLRRAYRLRLAAVYINHGLRPSSARREEAFCCQLCDRLGVDCEIVREDIAALARAKRQGIEETGRDFRYGVYETLAQADGHNRIALGHHRDDRVETILFNIARGSGRGGLIGMPPVRARIIRLLYDCSRSQILQYLKRHRLGYCEDQSNRSLDFSRNFVRHRVLPLLRQRLNPRVDEALIRLAELQAEEEQALQDLLRMAIRKCVTFTPGGKIELALVSFTRYDKWLRRRLLRHCITMTSVAGASIDRDVTDRLFGWLDTKVSRCSLPEGVTAERTPGKIVLVGPQARPFEYPVVPGRTCRLDWPHLTFRCRVQRQVGGKKRSQPRGRQVVLDASRVKLPLVVRNIRSGDRFVPLGMSGRKKVSDFLIDRKVPRVYRDEIPVVCDKEGIIWVVGHEIADRVKTSVTTKEVMVLEYSQQRCRQGEIAAV